MEIYSTLGRARAPFQPREPGKVGVYICGPTVQSAPHLGHGRSAVAFDVIRRYLEWAGYEVTYVQNVTDVEDKIIAAAEELGVSTTEVADQAYAGFRSGYEALGVLRPTIEPRATDHIPEMIEMIQELIAKGNAYQAGGDVYFAVRSFDGYGKLSGQSVDDLRSGARVEPDEGKRDPLDFALWKDSKPGEPSWESPWGMGRPGWHIECSAMARKYLGDDFDIHGGGQDLIFPHHENEIAQSEAATGRRFARVWMHNGMLNLAGEKMAKSTGHVIDLLEALDRWRPLAIRLFYLRTHYRKPLEFSEEAVEDAEASLDRLWAFRRRAPGPIEDDPDEQSITRFREAFEDDLDVAGALGVLFDVVRDGNRRLDAGEDAGPLLAAYDEMIGVFGLAEPVADVADLHADLERLAVRFGAATPDVEALIDRRTEARADRDWATSDAIRDELAAIGINLEDTADGVRWHRR
jgi:cysteinyl-tRNA synthetase